jgi:hypothetical protein
MGSENFMDAYLDHFGEIGFETTIGQWLPCTAVVLA